MNNNYSRILDIDLRVTAILGRSKMTLKEIFELTKGSLIELDTFSNQEVEILVNGKKIGYGQVVVVEQNFGVKITKILGEDELAKTLV
ncbi:flagellar motor switch protein FliN [Romboutsia maritimum]|uniref:Flagellar motor switch protein FliN n=1 Tax=Romboutsia maritimum TaxID=2020948 RepID=A0A371IVQ5_9FIRM|nr:FliM/FliN family flagellar motor switch protein [Romboutsia maritimum]RDY24548.1 flagellar motor switch protein FliN [Romboutsia maritimum]